MSMTDPIADMLTRIRNANMALHDQVAMPASKQKVALAEVLRTEGYIESYRLADSTKGPGQVLTINMKYANDRSRTISGLRRVSKPGLRVYRLVRTQPHAGAPAGPAEVEGAHAASA